ncbi:PREDICTED: telomeric repeat-binding factor 2-like isoform X1 [Poecilia mexicana]|uniref:telomeric repeat-binding factor 2-like isoform X1 n=1 Tax=Poecilia mexicana TaxID=48701 RepID=UPI00072DEA80|nr:PREDICTED: telomeric repeat-binding factor 2-like isoform X1 [Poecilia mexicana]
MAANKSVNIGQVKVEEVVNRWLVEYYFSLTVEFFKNQQYADFCAIRDMLDEVLERPIESVDDMPLKIRVLQFLSRINEGEKLDVCFEPDQSKTPLESALNLLESMKANFQIPQADFDYVSTLLKEMILVIFIKNGVFDKAKAALTLYFPSPGNEKRATLMNLICQKSNKHKVINQINFPQFRKEMLCFCQKLCPFTVPFLHKAALSLVESRIEVERDGAVRSDEQEEASPSYSPQVNGFQFRSRPFRRSIFIQKSKLEVAYKALAQCLEEKTFSDLEQEVEEESQKRVCLSLERCTDSVRGATQNSEQEALFQRKSVSPMEASPADQMTQTGGGRQAAAGSLSKTLYTVARFVVEPDSQPSSQCTTATEDLEVETRTTDSPQMPSPSNQELSTLQFSNSEREHSRPRRKLPRRGSNTESRASTSFIECSSDSEGESPPSGKKELEQPNESSSKQADRSREASEIKDEQQAHTNVSKSPKKRPLKWISKSSKACDPSSGEHVCMSDSSLDTSADVSSPDAVPQKSSTPHKDGQSKIPIKSLWRGHKNITEEKETWIDEDSLFPSIKKRGSGSNESTISNSGNRRRWTESETENLIQGVKKFGEGNWSKIKAYYSFNERTNVNIKDRWRTLKNKKVV